MIESYSPHPVVLVHGITDTHRKLRHIQKSLEKLGISVYAIDLTPNNGDGRLEVLAQQLKDFIDQYILSSERINLIGFSMGGLVSRYYLQRLGGVKRVNKFITISSPHKGTIAAYFSQREGCLQMRPESNFIQDLNNTIYQLELVDFTSLWTPFDLIIVPANSSELPVGRNIQLPIIAHPFMVSDRRVINQIINLFLLK